MSEETKTNDERTLAIWNSYWDFLRKLLLCWTWEFLQKDKE